MSESMVERTPHRPITLDTLGKLRRYLLRAMK
jgi:hypothetical protein